MRIVNIGIGDLSSGLKSVHDYWNGLRNGRMAPTWAEFELVRIPSSLLPTTLVIDIHEPLEKSVFRYWGSKMTEIHGEDMTSKHPHDLSPPGFGDQVLADHRKIVEKKIPMAWHYSFLAAGGYMHSHSVIRLPLSADGTNVTHIVVAIDYSREALDLIRQGREKYAEAVGTAPERPDQ